MAVRLPCTSIATARLAAFVLMSAFYTGCFQTPSVSLPPKDGSIGFPHRGELKHGQALAREGKGYVRLRDNGRHYGLPRFVQAITRAAARVSAERPGAPLVVGDLSAEHGGRVLPHFSHRSGRDADLLLYVTTLEGAPVRSPGFVHFTSDGLAWDPGARRYLRLDLERTWLLVRALLSDEEARVQWIFVNRAIKPMLLEWAEARGEAPSIVARADELMHEPPPGGAHGDHLHVRTECTDAEVLFGCERSGPMRAWIAAADKAQHEERWASPEMSDATLARALLSPPGLGRQGATGRVATRP